MVYSFCWWYKSLDWEEDSPQFKLNVYLRVHQALKEVLIDRPMEKI